MRSIPKFPTLPPRYVFMANAASLCLNSLKCTCPSGHRASKVMCLLGVLRRKEWRLVFLESYLGTIFCLVCYRGCQRQVIKTTSKSFLLEKLPALLMYVGHRPPTRRRKHVFFTWGRGVERRPVCLLIGQVHSGWVWNCTQVCGGTRFHRRPHPWWAGRNSTPHRDAFTRPNEVQLRSYLWAVGKCRIASSTPLQHLM